MHTKLTILLLFCLLLITVINVPLYPVLAIEKEDTEEVVAYGKRKQMEEFQIHFIHSIHKSPVVETYQIKDHLIVQQQITYEEFAVGMPSNVEGEGQFSEKDGHYMITDMNRAFPYLDIRIAQVMPDHGLILHNRFIPFSNIANPGSWIRLIERKISFWQMMKGVNLLERKKNNE